MYFDFFENVHFKIFPTLFSFLYVVENERKFELTPNCEEVFEFLNKTRNTPLGAYPTIFGGNFVLVYRIIKEVARVSLIRDSNFNQSPIYFVSKASVGAETRYQKI